MTRPPPLSGDIAFWDGVAYSFPSLKGAASTAYYFECEQFLLRRFFPILHGQRLFKTDLWDEAKNSEILRWAAERGARPFGIDIAFDTAREARDVLSRPCGPDRGRRRSAAAVSREQLRPDLFDGDHRALSPTPMWRPASSAGFCDPGGRAIIGVPNKLDPFLRPPSWCTFSDAVGLYAYGMEKSFTPRGAARSAQCGGVPRDRAVGDPVHARLATESWISCAMSTAGRWPG